jgi:serine phosphatase RsbU (regulator of sigma subunit)
VVNQLDFNFSDEILNKLREEIILALHLEKESVKINDGMDICLIVLNPNSLSVQYSGAYNPLIVISDELRVVDADRMPIAYHPKRNNPFTRYDIKLKPNDMLYLFTDGFSDQFDESNNRKYLLKNFKDLLYNIHREPIDNQKLLIENEFSKWKGESDQIDDVLVIGIRV